MASITSPFVKSVKPFFQLLHEHQLLAAPDADEQPRERQVIRDVAADDELLDLIEAVLEPALRSFSGFVVRAAPLRDDAFEAELLHARGDGGKLRVDGQREAQGICEAE